MTVESILLLLAIACGAAGLYWSSNALIATAAAIAAVFVVMWIQFELRPKDPWRKFRKKSFDE